MRRKGYLPQFLFIMLTACSVVFSVFWLVRTNGTCLDMIVSFGGNDRFMDFFNHITYVRDPQNVYFSSQHACFPPLVYFMYFLFSKMLPQDATEMYYAQGTSSYALLLYVCYCVMLAVFLFYSIYKLTKQRSIEHALCMTLLIMFSNIFIFGVLERGNSALIVCILLIRALELRSHEDKFSRELALILIAISAGIKIYPAVFGILYLVEKRWKEAVRLIVYGLLFFFVPFICFGGVEGLAQFVKNQMTIQTAGSGLGSIYALWNLITKSWLHMELQGGGVAVVVYLMLAFVGSIFATDFWKKVFLLASIMVVAPFWSGRYTPIYMAIPLILFFKEKRQNAMDYIYAILFAGMFLFLTYNHTGIAGIFGTNLPAVITYLAIYAMNVLLIIEAITGKIVWFVKNRKGRE